MSNVRVLSPELVKKAISELNEKPEKVQSEIDSLKEWIRKTPHLNARMDDQFLLTFLRGCKHSIEKTKQKIDLFYTSRTFMPELMKDRDPMNEKIQMLIRSGAGMALPLTERLDSPRIMLLRPGIYDPQKFVIQEAIKTSTMFFDYMLNEDDNIAIAGHIGILDMQNVTVAHLLQFVPSVVKKIVILGQDSSPFRHKGIHLVNAPFGIESVLSLFKSLLNEKHKSKIYVHHSIDSLYKHIPRRLLPTEYGGDAGSVQSILNEWEKRMMSYCQYFKEEEKYGSIESQRTGLPKNAESLFGIQGSFRQLDFD